MKDNNNNSKQVLLSVLGVAILVVAVVGVSFAAFSYSKTGEKVNTITTGTITMSYSETTNGINLTNALPMTDEVGKTLSEENQYFDFTVGATISGTTTINYAITAVQLLVVLQQLTMLLLQLKKCLIVIFLILELKFI